MKVGFLYNHDALHQIRHTAPVAAALVAMPGVAVSVLTSSAAQAEQARRLIGGGARYVALEAGAGAEAIDRVARRIAPFRRVAVLRRNRDVFAALDVLVVPETTSLLLRDRFGLDRLRYVWIPHGAGDRSIGFRPVARGFDLVLLSGRKVRDRMLATGVVTPDRARIVGYPKFDTVDPAAPRPAPFANDRPTAVYNPHFDPRLSSWYAMGADVLRGFARSAQFNLIFAPHVMLFRRRIHASVEHRRLRWRGEVPADVRGYDHLLIDTGSAKSSDMSHLRAADIYIGDASSQIYEWIARPRPAIFLNPARLDWRDDPDFAHWHLGEVVEDMAGLDAALDRAVAEPERYRAAQERAFADTFSIAAEPASLRAAREIVARFG